jgi:flagellum-specific peptidoglycan hydrolase FlgJ
MGGIFILKRRFKKMNPNTFIATVKPGAIATMKSRSILASLSIAQAILESGWGVHAPGNNLFGIKANGWKGKTQLLTTTEYVNGKTVTIKASFRVYDSWAESIDDHAVFIVSNSWYKNLIGCKDFKLVCQNIQKDGYATDPYYAQSLISLIEKYKLNQYDAIPKPAPAPVIYTVVKGDCLSKIASKYKTTYQHLAAVNSIKSPYIIKIGQKFKIA